MNKSCLITWFFCVCHLFALCQDISGFWKGTLNMENGCFTVNNIELQIAIKEDTLSGNSYHYSDVDNYVKKRFFGSYNSALKKLTLQERAVTTLKIPLQCKVCIKKYELNYSRNGNQEFLQGGWKSIPTENYTNCDSGVITLSRIAESAFKEIPEIAVDTGEIRLDFYDNGQIDDDSISVRINDKTVLTHQRLSAQPITTFVRIDLKNTFQEVEMVAENLGSIPPNTALLVITAGKKRYELFLSSSEQKSAKVRFLYEKGD